MPITSGTLTLLHSSEVEIGGNYSASQEQFLARFDDFYTQEEVTAWVLEDNNLQLCVTTKTIQNRLCVLHVLRARRHPKSRRAWFITLQWNPFDTGAYSRNTFGAEPLTKVSPKNADIEDPDTWEPVLLRRPSNSREVRPLAYYEGGYNGYTDTKLRSYGNVRQQPVNSAFIPIEGAPGGISIGASFVFRVLTKQNVNYNGLWNYEFTTNSSPVTISHKGLVVGPIRRHCLYCAGFNLTEQMVNNVHCWSIEIQFNIKEHPENFANTADDIASPYHGIGGYVDLYSDVSYDARAFAEAGDLDALKNGKPVTDPRDRYRKIIDPKTKMPTTSPMQLDGNGKENIGGAREVYGKWRYFPELNWLNFPYLNRIFVAP